MQCQGNKLDGTRCNRNAIGGTNYCYQHITGWWNKLTYYIAEILGVKRRFLIWVILFSILVFGIQLFANYNFTKVIDELKFKPDVEVEISPYLQSAPFGDYLPMIVTNTGDYTFKNSYIGIYTCDMEDTFLMETYELPLLPAHTQRIIPFGNKKVIENFKKGNCYPFSAESRSIPSISFNPYQVSLGKEVNASSVGCGVCYFDVKFLGTYITDNKNETFKKNITGQFDAPIELVFMVSSDNV